MEVIKFAKMNPNKNTTILVIDSYPRHLYASISKRLMAEESVCAEQVGFIEKAQNPSVHSRLQMMGGEFCANGVVALCGYLSHLKQSPLSTMDAYNIEVSGSEDLVICQTKRFENKYRSKISMPLPTGIEEELISYKGQLIKTVCVAYADVLQRIVCENQDVKASEELAYYLLNREGEDKFATKGVTFYSEQNNRIKPLIYVKETDTSIWENSCGIASASIAAYIGHKKSQTTCLEILQPSGDLVEAEATYINGKIDGITIEEDVYLSMIGSAYINLEEGD